MRPAMGVQMTSTRWSLTIFVPCRPKPLTQLYITILSALIYIGSMNISNHFKSKLKIPTWPPNPVISSTLFCFPIIKSSFVKYS